MGTVEIYERSAEYYQKQQALLDQGALRDVLESECGRRVFRRILELAMPKNQKTLFDPQNERQTAFSLGRVDLWRQLECEILDAGLLTWLRKVEDEAREIYLEIERRNQLNGGTP